MQHSGMYHSGNRALQARFGSTALADRLVERVHRTAFTEADKAFIESRAFFFLASADAEGKPDCSFKGGAPGLVQVTGPSELVWPDYDGNGMFKSLGNIAVNPQIGLLFIALEERPRRLRVNGRATLSFDDPEMQRFAGAQALIRVQAEHIFPNCPRYIPDLSTGALSPYAPGDGPPLEPGWKASEDFRDVVPPRKA
jgi:predicted pyridoxine 5'-phosphate oxidase superfamily flavin-nucleotide-binding protein